MLKNATQPLAPSVGEQEPNAVGGARNLIKETEDRLLKEFDPAGPDDSDSDKVPGRFDQYGVAQAGRWALQRVPIANLRPSADQLRRQIDHETLSELAQTIAATGLLQPLLVRPDPGRADRFEIVAGVRRWRAAKLAGATDVPVVVADLSDRAALESALIENIQRADLNPLEFAAAYQRLISEHHHTQESLARIMGKSRSHVANTLRLLNLPATIQQMLQAGQLSAGHARVLLGAPQPEGLAKHVITRDLSVRQTEKMARAGEVKRRQGHMQKSEPSPEAVPEPRLSAILGQRVTVSCGEDKCGVTIHCDSAKEVAALIERLERALSTWPAEIKTPVHGAPAVPIGIERNRGRGAGRASSVRMSQEELKNLAAQYGYPWP